MQSTLRDPRVLTRLHDKTFTRIPKPSEEVPLTVVVPVMHVDWVLWEVIFSLNFMQYKNVQLLFIVRSPKLVDDAVSVLKTYRAFLPENIIFTPKRELAIYDIMNVALSSVRTDHFCLLMPHDYIHPSALSSVSEAILKHDADFYYTYRYKAIMDGKLYCAPPLAQADPWTGVLFNYRGLHTFKKSTLVELGGFRSGVGLQDPALTMIYELLNAEVKVQLIPEYLYVSRMSKAMHATRGAPGQEWRRKLITEYWPHRMKSDLKVVK